MASRSHVDVNERRLRPIYDSLDNGNNKKAIQEAEKVLKKQKDFQCAKVLKALALLRLNRHEESSVILQEVHAQHPTEDSTLQAMSICYREVHKLDLIADLYQNAFSGKPDNEDILSALFMAHVRLGDYKKQQQTAMQLHKLKPHKNPYYFWAVMSIVMQAHTSPDKKLSEKMYLPLAERMTEKYIKDDNIEAEAEVMLYLIILELLGKWQEAVNLLEGPLGGKFVSEFNLKDIKLAELYSKLENWSKANIIYKRLLQYSPDHWQYWLDYLKSALALIESNDQIENQNGKDENEETADDSVEKILELIEELSTKGCSPDHYNRGPFLARIKLISLLEKKDPEKSQDVGSTLQLLIEHFERFGDRSCCFGDFTLFLDQLTDSQKLQFFNSIKESIPLNGKPKEHAQDVKLLQRHLIVLQVERYLGYLDPLPIPDKLTLIHDLIDRYRQGLQLSQDLLITDLQHSDNYLLLAVHLLVDLWRETNKDEYIWQAQVQLEQCIKKSPSNFQAKLILIRLYCTMGVFGPCPSLYDSIEIKHIMNDSLGHIVFNHVARLGHFVAACAMYGTMLRFFTVNHKETTEYLISSYKYGSFSKIYEFVKFRERLQNSLQFASATAERLLLDLIFETNSHSVTEQMIIYMEISPEDDKTNFDELRDNRDYKVMLNWDNPSKFNVEELQDKSFEEEKCWLRVRNYLLRILAAAVLIGQEAGTDGKMNGVTEIEKEPMTQTLQELSAKLENHIDDCVMYKEQYQVPYVLQAPFRTRLCYYLINDHHRVLIEMVDAVLYTHKLQQNNLELNDVEEDRIKSAIPKLVAALVNTVEISDNGSTNLSSSVIENLVLCAETFSFTIILAGVCNRFLKPLKIAQTKKLKKKKSPLTELLPTFENFNELLKCLEKGVACLHLACKQINPGYLELDMSKLNLSQPLTDHADDAIYESEMWKKVEKSYEQAAQEISELLHNKLQYLHTLRL
ncbi:N-alpha-acetyltransferase 25, NatB auxiliary subunit [Patella vulgata]|uniref:N-alpha-acetyltransferase 25, NatB auxiliary subunit n=1 Tax=Patella vulgata TaxID=6465 RepID=UPI00217F2453|nr:N-alpha-acetyltransferase 25, NatB auxiliary subunit [Patella vulgata]